jgi:large subunit ribosomal protein L4e
MKVPVFTLEGKNKGEVSLGKAFKFPVREDIIKRAFLASLKRQAYGADPLAGKRTSAHYHGKRHYRWTMMNREMARMKRIHGQGFLNFTARFVTQAVKGRKAHPPKAGRNWDKKMNKKEMIFAVLSAISASSQKDIVLKRGHKVDGLKHLPIVVDDKFSEIKKTKEISTILKSLGLEEELKRTAPKKVRAGKGKFRGRKYSRKKGPLVIIKEGKFTGKNIPGIDAVKLDSLSITDLAPGGTPGRVCVWTESAIKEVEKMVSS